MAKDKKKKEKLERWTPPAESFSNVKSSGNTGVTYSYSQPKQTSGGTRIVGTGGGTMQHTDAGAQKVAALSGSKYSKAGAVVDAFSRGVGKTTKTNNAATAFKPAPVMSKPKQTKQDRLATVSAELDEMRDQRKQLVMANAGFKGSTDTVGNSKQISELTDRIQQPKKQQKELAKDVNGYTGKFFADTAKRVGRTIAGSTKSVVGQAAETLGQISHLGTDGDPQMFATTGAMINEVRNPGALQHQQQAAQARTQSFFDASDKFAEESAQHIESAKGGLGIVGQTAVDVGSEGMKMLGDAALNSLIPGSGKVGLAIRAFGGGAQEARYDGATSDQQFLYGASQAAIELFAEGLSNASLPFKKAYGGAMRVGGKTLDDALDSVIGKVVKDPVVRKFVHSFAGEWLEEDFSDIVNPVAKLIYDKDAVKNTYLTAEGRQQLAEDLLRDGVIGGILGALGATGDAVTNTAVGNRLMKNGGSGAANVLASAASFPEQSEAHKTATELIERHDQGGKITAYELGNLVHQMQEAAAHGVYPDETGGSYEVVRDARGRWQVVHQVNETALALSEKGLNTPEAVQYATVLDSLARGDDLSASQIKRKLDVFSPAVREQVEEMTGRALPEATSKADTARAIKAAFTEYRAEVEEEERLAEAEQQAAAEAEERAAIAEESDAEAAQFMEQAVAEQEQAVAQEQAQQAQQQQAEEPSLVQPLETLEEFLARKEEDATRRYGEGLSEDERKDLTQAWEQSTKEDGIRLDDGTTIGFAEFVETMGPYLSKEEGYKLSDSKLMAAFNRFRAGSAERPFPRATWEKNIAATRGDTSAQPESVTAEETAEEEPGASVLSVEEESAPVEETPAEESVYRGPAVPESERTTQSESPSAAQGSARKAFSTKKRLNRQESQTSTPAKAEAATAQRNYDPSTELLTEEQLFGDQAAEEKPAEKKPTQPKKTRPKKQTVIPTKAEAEAAKTAVKGAETEQKTKAAPVEEVFTSPKQYADNKRKEVFGATIASYLKSKLVKGSVDRGRARLILTTKSGPKYISFTGSELVPATEEMVKLASDTPDMGGVSAMPTGVSEAPTVEKLLTDEYQLVETAPEKITLPSGMAVYEFNNGDGGKVYFYHDYFKVADGGILYLQKGAEHPAIKSVNEDGTLRAFVMPTFAKGVQDGVRVPSKLKSFSKAMQAKIQSAPKTSGAEIEKKAAKNTDKKGGVKHSIATQSKNPNIQTNENVTLEQRLAAEFLMDHLQSKGIKGIVFDGKNLEGENGHIDKKSGIVYLNENYLDTAMAVAQTVGHEIFHAGVEGDANLVNSMLESAKKLVDEGKLTGRNGYRAARWLKDIDAEVERRAADYRAFLEANGADAATIAEETSPEAMREEIACDLMGMVLNNQSALDTIAQTEPTLLDRIVEALDRLLGGRYSRMANYATGGEDTSFARYGKDYANTVKELDKIAERLSTALDNYRDGTRVVESSELENSDARTLTEDMGDGTVVEADENGDLVFAQNKAEHSTAFSLATWQVGQAKLRRALEEEGHSTEEIDDIINRVDSIAEFIEDIGDEYAEMGYDKLKNNLIADIVTDVRTGKQVLSALVKNGDYPVNFDLALICKKRVAYMNLISRLVKDGVMDKVTFGAEAIAKVNEILRDRGFETACLGCFVESRRLQIQKWAETIVKEWNEEVDKRTKNAPDFGFAKGKNAELTVDDLAAIQQEYEGVDLNEKGNKKLRQASVKNKMGQLLNTTPSLLKHLTVEDLLTPQGISALRQRDGSLFSLVQQRYGAASPKIVQDFNPYNGEIADLSFEFVKDRFGDGIKGKDAYIADAKAELAVEEGGLPTKQKGESKEDFEKRKAEFNTRAENMAIRQYLYDIGGARIQSFSDFMIENVFDYIQIYADLAARKFPMHGYTKEIIALRLFGLTGQKWNGSLIAHTERSQGKELAGLLPVEEAKNGHGIVVTDPMTGEQYAICFDDYRRNQRTSKPAKEYLAAHGGKEENLSEAETQEYNRLKKQASFIQSIGMKDIFALQLDSRYSPFVGSITIGVSDAQIRAMLNHPLFSMVIPYHKSGMLPMYAELVGVDMYNDYTDYQNTRVGTVYGKDGKPLTRAVDLDGNPIPPKTVRGKKVDYAPGVYKKKDDGWTRVSADTRYDFNAKVQELGDAKAAAQAYIDWCYKDHPIYNGDDVVGYETFLPKFSDSPEGYDFTQEENYYKLLEDFVSYDTVTGEPVLQGDVQMNFPEADSLSADELDAYKQRLRDTGLYTAKEIERYAEKAQMGFKDIVREALDERKQYHDATDPQWEDTVSQVTNALLGDDHLRSTPAERQKAWKKEDKAAKKAEKQKGVKRSLNWERHPVTTQDRIPADVNDLQKEYEQATAEGNKDWQQQLVQQAALNSPYRTFAYHGSPVTDIDVFRTRSENEGKQRNQLLFGAHFTQRRPYAEIYTKKVKGSNGTNRMNYNSTGGKVYEVALDLGNSLDLTTSEYVLPGSDLWNLYEDLPKNAKKKVPVREFSAYDTEQGLGEGKFFMPSYLELALQAMSPKAATDFLVAHNINSVIYDANYGAGGMVSNKLATDPSIIILDPERIKSLEPETRDDNGNVIPLTERFNPKEQRIRYSLPTDTKQMDEEYMAAVESGDTARAQEMVDEAAKRAGYDIRAYHGTKADFTVFDGQKAGSNYDGWSRYGDGFYFSPAEKDARHWAESARTSGKAKVMPVYLKSENLLDLSKPVRTDAAREYLKSVGVKDPNAIERNLAYASRFVDMIRRKGGDIQKVLKDLGYEGIDATTRGSDSQYIIFEPTNVKSSDPVTYDDDGNVIPLSERFNPKQSDIRYSLRDGEESGLYIPDTVNKKTGETVSFVDLILDKLKPNETRATQKNGRKPNLTVGKWVGISKGGKNPQVVGRVIFGEPYEITNQSPEYKSTFLADTRYELKDGETRWYYPILQVEDWRDNPQPVTRFGSRPVYNTPVSAFTEKGRKYSVRGQVPEFDAIFDFYANYGLTNDAPKAPPKPQVSRVRSKTYERMGVPRSFDEEHRQALDESEFEYDPIAEQESMRRAEERLTNDYEGEKKDLSKRNWRNGEDLDTAMGILATELNLAKETGDYDETIEWLHLIREQGTKAGQFIQAFAKYNRSPEGILARAVDDLEKSKLSSDERKELIQKITDFAATLSKLRPKADGSVDPNALVDLIVQQAKQRNTKVSKGSMKVLQRLVNEGDIQYLYNFALTQLDQIAKDYIPASLGRKVGTYQTISHLLNLRTGNRNLVSNTAFGSIAATANNFAMIPDTLFSLLTGSRTVGLDRGHLSKETWRGIKEGGARARLGINLDVQPDTNARDKYGTSKRTWKMTGNFVQRQMSRVEKLMAYELNWTDEFRKGGVRAEIIQGLAPMVERGDITMEVAKEWAEQEALYRTFQDDTYVNKLLGNVKKLLNMKLVSEVDANGKKTYHIGQMDFGLGDIVQKYTQVPGALITRAIELSPAGYLKAIYLMGSMAKTASASKQAKTAYEVAKQTAEKSDKERLKRAANRAFEKSVKADVVAKSAQRDAALALGRAITGTGLIAAFAALAKMGLLKRADDEDDPDAKALNAAEGITGTQLNLSAIRRLINGESPEWRQGDVLASVEFLEPMNNEMTMGAKIAKSIAGGKNDLGTFTLDTFDALYQSMQEIPTMQTLQTINQTIQYHKEDDPLPVWAEIPIEIARSGITGFVPSLVRQTAQASDPYYRDAYTSRDLGDQIKDTVKNAIPGLRQQLPVKLDNFGRPKAQENQPLNALNAFIIPGSVRTYQQSEATGKLQDLYDQTGKANIFPDRSAPYNVSYSVDKQQTKFDLTPEERQVYQNTRGQVTLKTLVAAMSDGWYKGASADEKVEIVEKAKAYGNYKAKVQAAAEHGEVYSDSEYDHIDTAIGMGYTMSSYLTVKGKCNSFSADKDKNGKSISGSKMKKIIDYLSGLNLTDQQRAYMFELTSGSNKTPFGSY